MALITSLQGRLEVIYPFIFSFLIVINYCYCLLVLVAQVVKEGLFLGELVHVKIYFDMSVSF